MTVQTDTTSEAGPDGRDEEFDVVVVGGGNAGFCAALAAADEGASVLVLEKAPFGEHGGNTFYTAGATRVAFSEIDDLVPLLDQESVDLLPRTVVPPYPEAAFREDMARVTEGRNDPELTEILVGSSTDTVRWLHAHGIGYRLMFERQAYEREGVFTFFGNLVLGVVGGGKGLVEQHLRAADRAGVQVRYGAAVTGLLTSPTGEVDGVVYQDGEVSHRVSSSAVVLAAGGFESDPERRRRHLGEGWEHALVRGTPTNTGEVLDLAIALGAEPYGDWGSCHSVAWDAGADPKGGDRELTNQLTRQSYPLGVVVNRDGARFLDEGEDYRNYTYAKYGARILRQPGAVSFQLFDSAIRPMLRSEEYDSTPISAAEGDTIEQLAAELGIDPVGLRETLDHFNTSITDRPFDPAVKDGRASRVDPPKSNWALAIQEPPFYGYPVACGITFTFGGLRIDEQARALTTRGEPIDGLYVAGEMVGGLFSGNYPGGSGLTSGSVFGRIAGTNGGARAAAARKHSA
ncbi:FAD-dependent tricarballylate dehydrogenase TcuA [Pseudonocardia pini]|uniref:FAD-dependent tricarballylate dehydrogenase TcuA n=1 Tax=Pseudonocardia pini TaxID=2758030 RepID=UPI0015F10D43|nr:FAD-dependent tricarballylate dehydrogenase TcuA [Pseudonocardia pini]